MMARGAHAQDDGLAPGLPAQWRPTWRREFVAADLDCPLFVEGGVSVQRESLGLDDHAHPGWELHVIASGTMVTELANGDCLEAIGGDLVLTAPGVQHRGLNYVIPPSKLMWLVLGPMQESLAKGSGLLAADLARIERCLREAGTCVMRAPSLVAHVRVLMRLLREQPLARGSLRAAQVRSACAALVLEMAHVLGGADQQTAGPVTLAARAWLAEHLDQPIAVPALAKQHGLAPSRFHEVFLAETGETPAACHLRLRIAAAARLLRDRPDDRVGAIAAKLGFADQRYFATCFRRHTGMSPSTYRRIAYRGSRPTR